jgi:hypothetical protein
MESLELNLGKLCRLRLMTFEPEQNRDAEKRENRVFLELKLGKVCSAQFSPI